MSNTSHKGDSRRSSYTTAATTTTTTNTAAHSAPAAAIAAAAAIGPTPSTASPASSSSHPFPVALYNPPHQLQHHPAGPFEDSYGAATSSSSTQPAPRERYHLRHHHQQQQQQQQPNSLPSIRIPPRSYQDPPPGAGHLSRTQLAFQTQQQAYPIPSSPFDPRPLSAQYTSPPTLSPYAPGFLHPSHPLSASSSSSLGERVLRSPHPPLTASLQPPHLWPTPLQLLDPNAGASTAVGLGIGTDRDRFDARSRPFFSSPIVDGPSVPGPSYLSPPLITSPYHQHPYHHPQLAFPSAPPYLPPITTRASPPVLIPRPLTFRYSATPPDLAMPPRKKATASTMTTTNHGILGSSSTPQTVSSLGDSRSRKIQHKGNGWTMEHTYDSVLGKQKEIIVIDDSQTPEVPRKRTRAQVAAEAQAANASTGSYVGSSKGLTNGRSVNGTGSVQGSAKKRKVEEQSDAGSAKKPKPKAAVPVQLQHQVVTKPPPVNNVSQTNGVVTWDDPEGHYIVKPDDVIANKYKIVRLLGQGTFGKVVEARHIESRRKVAIKVIRAVQKYRDASKIEIRVLETLRKNDPGNENKCIHLEEYFDFRNHPCLVSELYGMSVFDFLKQNAFQPFPERHIQDFAKSLLKSVQFLHRLKLVHTDLKPENILLVSNEARLQGPRRAGAKSRSVLRNTDIRLIDFGSATFENEYHSSVVSTRHYRAPEIILGLSWSYPCDMFSIGCILVEFFTGDALFQTHDNLEHLAMMEVVMGKMPGRMVERGRVKKPEFFKGSKIDFPNPTVSRSSRKFVKSLKTLKEIIPPINQHNTVFLDLIVRLLDFDPDTRITVNDALRHPYIRQNIPDPV